MLKDQRGFILLPVALAGLLMGTLLVTSFLASSSTVLRSTRSSMAILLQQAAANAAVEDAIWQLYYESGFAASLMEGTGTVSYPLTVNNVLQTVTVDYSGGSPPPEDGETINQGVVAWVTQNPVTIEPLVPNTVTYTINIENQRENTVKLDWITDLVPPGLNYVAGSTVAQFDDDVYTFDPTITDEGGQERLTWDFPPPRPKLKSGESGFLTFQASGTPQWGTFPTEYCVEVQSENLILVCDNATSPVYVGTHPHRWDVKVVAPKGQVRVRLYVDSMGKVRVESWMGRRK